MSLRLLLGTGPDGAPPYLHRRSVVQRFLRPWRDLYAFLGLQHFLVDLRLRDPYQFFLFHRLPTIWKTPLLPPYPPPPRAFADFFQGPRPLLSRWRLRPVRTLRLFRRCHRMLRTFCKVPLRRWYRAGKPNGLRTWNYIGNSFKVMLHLSRLRAPLYPKGTWAPTHCGRWVPLTTERRHGLSISPVQNEQAVTLATTAAPARGLLLIALGQGTADLRRHRAPLLPRDTDHPLPSAHAETDARGPMTVVHPKAGSVLNAIADLGPLALQVTGAVITLPLLHLHAGIGVARLPLVGPPGPAWLRGLLGAPHRRLRAGLHLIDDGLAIPHATVFHLLRPVLVGLIIAYHPPLLGRLHPKGLEPRISLTLAAPPGLSARSVVNTHMIRIFVSCDCGRTLMMNRGWRWSLCGKGPKTFRRSDTAARTFALRRSHSG